MPLQTPTRYHALPPFLEWFDSGLPALMYHKVGRRPFGVKIKGLYVSSDRFAQQMRELKAAGFSNASFGDAPVGKKIVLSFDDGYRNVLENASGPMVENGFRGIQFLVANLLGGMNEWDIREGEKPEPLMSEAETREWLAAGHEIGSHTLNHARLTRLSLRDAREEVFASKKKLEDIFGRAIEHFCYPYGDWNEPISDLVLEAGYRTACTTRFGINTKDTPAQSLFRIPVRHPTRTLKGLSARLFKKKTG